MAPTYFVRTASLELMTWLLAAMALNLVPPSGMYLSHIRIFSRKSDARLPGLSRRDRRRDDVESYPLNKGLACR